jgi:hypothetical protein
MSAPRYPRHRAATVGGIATFHGTYDEYLKSQGIEV